MQGKKRKKHEPRRTRRDMRLSGFSRRRAKRQKKILGASWQQKSFAFLRNSSWLTKNALAAQARDVTVIDQRNMGGLGANIPLNVLLQHLLLLLGPVGGFV